MSGMNSSSVVQLPYSTIPEVYGLLILAGGRRQMFMVVLRATAIAARNFAGVLRNFLTLSGAPKNRERAPGALFKKAFCEAPRCNHGDKFPQPQVGGALHKTAG